MTDAFLSAAIGLSVRTEAFDGCGAGLMNAAVGFGAGSENLETADSSPRPGALEFSCCHSIIDLGFNAACTGCEECAPLLQPDYRLRLPIRSVAEHVTAKALAEVIDCIAAQRVEVVRYYESLLEAAHIEAAQQLNMPPGLDVEFTRENPGRDQAPDILNNSVNPKPHRGRALAQFRGLRLSPQELIERLLDLAERIRSVQTRSCDLRKMLRWKPGQGLVLTLREHRSFDTVIDVSPRGLIQCAGPWRFGLPKLHTPIVEPVWRMLATISHEFLGAEVKRKILQDSNRGPNPAVVAARQGLGVEFVVGVLNEDILKSPPETAERASARHVSRPKPRIAPMDQQRVKDCRKRLKLFEKNCCITLADARQSLFGDGHRLSPVTSGVPDIWAHDWLPPPAATLTISLTMGRNPDWRWEMALREAYRISALSPLGEEDRRIVRRAKRLAFEIDRAIVEPASPDYQAYKLWCQTSLRNVTEALLIGGAAPAQIDGLLNLLDGATQSFIDFYFDTQLPIDVLQATCRRPVFDDDELAPVVSAFLKRTGPRPANVTAVRKAVAYLAAEVPGTVPQLPAAEKLSEADHLDHHFQWTAKLIGPAARDELADLYQTFCNLRAKQELLARRKDARTRSSGGKPGAKTRQRVPIAGTPVVETASPAPDCLELIGSDSQTHDAPQVGSVTEELIHEVH